METNRHKKGITAIELLVVIAVLGVIFSIAIPQFSKIRENQVLKSAVGDIISSLNKARSQTLASINSSSYGVRFQSGKVIIFKGTAFSPSTSGNETIDIITPASITNVVLGCTPSIPCDIYFNRLSGTPSKTGTITISTSSFSKVITISATGSASMN
jgi:prepilin-type N-terminal cleavage/methylation domain-containing protein